MAFTTDRSRSLWSQLVAPPPLQPPNWVKSRIRRLFLISLGVPVDLDQILPAKKQKKLVLDSKHFGQDGLGRSSSLRRTDTGTSTAPGTAGGAPDKAGISRSQTDPGTSSTGTTATTTSSRRRGPPPPPDLDLTAVQRLSSTTDEALNGLTDEELKEHVALLEEVTQTASKVLEYWAQMRDGQVSEKTAFEGVIENLVKHARQVRK
ncbi:hypothetical protein KEM55_000468 [Ascosphaera atra]|nr:hypothetical protein KEM55_000468 [Ascosphaera atra]